MILLAGGVGKDADFSPLAEVIKNRVKSVIVFGQDAHLIEAILKEHVEVRHALDLPGSVLIANEQSQQGDLVLLSPACASFDMFENYEARGTAFVDAVKKLEGIEP